MQPAHWRLMCGLCLLAACSAPLAAATPSFRNPLAVGADPFIVMHEGRYLVLWTRGSDIAIYQTDDLNNLDATEPVRVWCMREDPYHIQADVWAPELHYVSSSNGGGGWYIYASGKRWAGSDKFSLFALESVNPSNPLGPYRWAGYTLPAASAIDASLFTWEGRTYFLWSQFDPHPGRDGWQQCVWLAPAASPARIGQPRLQLSCAQYPWESVGHHINEGPIALQRGGRLFIVYSASLAMTPDYSLGLIEYLGGDILRQSSWHKLPEPLLTRDDEAGIYGPGHNGFTRAAGGSWVLLYHVKTTCDITFDDRVLHAKAFDWDPVTGRPIFGHPAPITYHQPLGPIRRGNDCPVQPEAQAARKRRALVVVLATALVVVLGLTLAASFV